MNYINNLGDYVECLHAALRRAVGVRAVVQYDHEPEVQDKPKPYIKVSLPEIEETSFASDGRQQDTLVVTVLIKAPKALSNPSVEAANIGGFVRAIMTNQYFTDSALMAEDALHFDVVDAPEDIQGYPLKWHDNDQGYAITFEQTLRYGSTPADSFVLVGMSTIESNGKENIVYDAESIHAELGEAH